MRALFVLTPNESKRLIAKAVANMEEVKTALKQSNMIIFHGSTDVLVLEEVLGEKRLKELMNPATYLSGLIIRGTLCSTLGTEKPPVVLIRKGVVTPPPDTMSEMLRDFGRDSVVIKGANAIDKEGNAGAFVAHPEGGGIGWSIGTILARGFPLIVPAGLEKLVPSVRQSVSLCGQETLDYCQGKRVGMIPLSPGKVVTEIEAMKILTGVDAYHVASGGVNGSEGSVTLVAEGSRDGVNRTIKLVELVKGEPSINFRKGICEICFQYSPAQPKNYDASGFPKFCQFQETKEKELPPYLRNR
jgi:hypothetical protein